MENRVVVEVAVDVAREVRSADRSLLVFELDFNRAEAGVEHDAGRFGRCCSHEVGGEQHGAGGDDDFFSMGQLILIDGFDCDR